MTDDQDQYQRYDYAWQQRGWNVQNPTFLPPDQESFTDPGLPDDVAKVNITGVFMDPISGGRLEGTIEYRVSDILLYSTTDSDSNPVTYEVMPSVRQLRFTEAEPLNISLPATDDDNLVTVTGDPWVWMFRLTVEGVTREFSAPLPKETASVQIWDLM